MTATPVVIDNPDNTGIGGLDQVSGQAAPTPIVVIPPTPTHSPSVHAPSVDILNGNIINDPTLQPTPLHNIHANVVETDLNIVTQLPNNTPKLSVMEANITDSSLSSGASVGSSDTGSVIGGGVGSIGTGIGGGGGASSGNSDTSTTTIPNKSYLWLVFPIALVVYFIVKKKKE